jgi:hydrogenase maturation protease
VLGIGNLLMADEGVGVYVAQALGARKLPDGVEVLDGGSGGFVLLGPMEEAGRIILVDAAVDGNPVGTVTRTRPRFARDYPPTLTAHDIGMKDLLDVFYIRGGERDVTLYAISIDPQQPLAMEMSETIQKAAEEAVVRIFQELTEGGEGARF